MKKKSIRLISLMLATVMAATAIVYVSADEQAGFFTELFSSEDNEETVLSGSAAEAEIEKSTDSKEGEENNEKADLESIGESNEEIAAETVLSGSALNMSVAVDLVSDDEVVVTGSCGENAIYTLYDSGELIISGSGSMNDYRSSVSPWSSTYKTEILSVVISDGITSIGNYMFYNCSNLTEIAIPDSVTSIGSYAFYNCSSLTELTIPDSITSIESAVFGNCSSLMKVIIPNSVTSIGNDVFYDCSSLTELTIPDSITNIGYFAFYGCSGLTKITIPDSVTSIGNTAFYGCSDLTEITISNNITSIESSVFMYCSSLTEITIPDGVTSIGSEAFYGCSSLTEITIPDGVTSIGSEAFYGCSSLTEITIPDSVTSIESYTFYNCKGLTSITFSENLISIGDYAFRYCENLKSIILPDTLESIGSYAFADCPILWNIEIPSSVTSINSYTFYNCSKSMLVFYVEADSYALNYAEENGYVYVIGSYDSENPVELISGFCGDNVEYVLYNDRKLLITGSGATYDFTSGNSAPWYSYNSYIISAVIESGVTNIGTRAFYNCSSLFEITIPDSVTSIGETAFYNCSSLLEIIIPDSVTNIGSSAFYGCSSLTEITIPDGITSIERSTFHSCKSLTEITIPDSITSIGNYAFEDCSALSEITIPSNVTYIGNYAFYGCSALSEIIIPNSVTYIGTQAFRDCTELLEITIPDSVTSISSYIFYDCSKLTEVTIPDSVTSIGVYAFYGCSALTEITIPDCITSIGNYTFYGCSSLTEIIIPESVTSIGTYAFYGCSDLESIYIPEGAKVSSSNSIEGFSGSATVYCYSGTTAYTYATKLGYNIFLLDDHEHEYEENEVVGSCTKQGYTVYTCSVCGYSYKDNYYGGEGHNFGEWIVGQEATVFCDGYYYRTCSVCGETETETISKISVDIDSNTNYGLANFTIVDASTLEPIGGAAVYIYTESDGEGTVYADSSGKLSVVLPVGKQQIQVYASGYETRTLTVTIVSGEQNIAAIGLSTDSLVSAELTVTLMTEEEIEEAGIDVEAEDNNQVYKYEATLVFDEETYENNTLSYTLYYGSGSGKIYSEPEKYKLKKRSTSGSALASGGGGYVTATIYPISEKYYLVIVGEVKWLKEMFDVQLVVINNSGTDTIENCIAELVLPDGLSLASMTSGVQSASQNIDYVEENGTETVHWYVRGDTEGEYTLTAKLDGELMPFEEEFSYEYTTTEPLKVYAGSALHMTIKAPGTTYYGDNYPITIELENVSDRTIYNLSHTILSLEQFKATTYSDGSVVEESYIDTEQDQVSVTRYNADGTVSEEITTTVDDYVIGEATADEFKPGDKLIIELTSNIMFESDVINGKAAQILAAVEEAQKVLDAYNCSTAGSEILKDAYSVIEETASSINFVVNDDDVAEDSKKEAYSELAVAVGQLLRIIKTGSSSSLQVIERLEKTGVYDDFYEISQDTSYYSTHTEESINSILKVANAIISGCSEEEFETYSVFNILKSIAESMPVSFILEDVFVTTLEGSTTEIPYTVEITEGDSPVSYNVEAVGSYLYSLLCSAMGSDVPRFADVFSGSTEYSDYEDVIQHVKAVQNGTTTIAVEAASGDISFRAWVESALTTADLDDSVSVSSDFTLSSDNETAYIDEDGVLNFTGAGFINVTSSVETSGILYVEMTNGDETDVTAYVIDVVEEHTCSSDEWVTVVEPTEDSEGYMVKVCDVCGDVIDIKTTTLCESHSFGSYVVEVEPTEDEYGLKVKTCETCGYKQYSVIGISDTLELTEDSAYTIDESSGYVSGISDKTSIADFIANFDNDSEDIVILDTNGTEVDVTSTAYIGTGFVIQNIYNGEVSDQLTVVIAGDVNGDGEKDVLDLAKLFDHIQEVSALEGAYLQAAYINSDDEIDVLDLAELFDKIQS